MFYVELISNDDRKIKSGIIEIANEDMDALDELAYHGEFKRFEIDIHEEFSTKGWTQQTPIENFIRKVMLIDEKTATKIIDSYFN